MTSYKEAGGRLKSWAQQRTDVPVGISVNRELREIGSGFQTA